MLPVELQETMQPTTDNTNSEEGELPIKRQYDGAPPTYNKEYAEREEKKPDWNGICLIMEIN